MAKHRSSMTLSPQHPPEADNNAEALPASGKKVSLAALMADKTEETRGPGDDAQRADRSDENV